MSGVQKEAMLIFSLITLGLVLFPATLAYNVQKYGMEADAKPADAYPYGNWKFTAAKTYNFSAQDYSESEATIGCGIWGTDSNCETQFHGGKTNELISVCRDDCHCGGAVVRWYASGLAYFFVPESKDAGEPAEYDGIIREDQQREHILQLHVWDDDVFTIHLYPWHDLELGSYTWDETEIYRDTTPSLSNDYDVSSSSFTGFWKKYPHNHNQPARGWLLLQFMGKDNDDCQSHADWDKYYVDIQTREEYADYYFPAIDRSTPHSFIHLNESSTPAHCFDHLDNDGDWAAYDDDNRNGVYDAKFENARSDVGVDGCSDWYEDGNGGCDFSFKHAPYQPDPNGDNYPDNPNGTEGDGYPQPGERFIDCSDPDCYGINYNGSFCPDPLKGEGGEDPQEECNDGLDTDGDGNIDMNDDDCRENQPYDCSAYSIIQDMPGYNPTANNGYDGCCGDDNASHPRGDRGFVDDHQQYLCLQDEATDGSIAFSKYENWRWWNAQDASLIGNENGLYRIHEHAGTDFVPNGESWFYCDATNTADYAANEVGRYEHIQQGTLTYQSDCVCNLFYENPADFTGATCDEDANTTTYCCDYEGSGGATCENGTVVDLAQCGHCYGANPNVALELPEEENTTNTSYPDTEDMMNPEDTGLRFDPDASCEENQGKHCPENTVCVSDLPFWTGLANGEYCCVAQTYNKNDISCEAVADASCEGQGGAFCPTGFGCKIGHQLRASDTGQQVCCESQEYCFDPLGQEALASQNRSQSFLCYQDQGKSLFAECCNEVDCQNAAIQSNLHKYPYDTRVFGVGTPLHALQSFEIATNNKKGVRTRVLKKEGPITPAGTYGIGFLQNLKKNNFTGFSHLRFSLYYDAPQTGVPQLVLQDADAKQQSFPLLDYTTNGKQPGKWLHILLPLAEADRLDLSQMQRVFVTGFYLGAGEQLVLDNLHLTKEDASLADPYATRYCSGNYKQWVDDLDYYDQPPRDWSWQEQKVYAAAANQDLWGPYKDACTYNLYRWTGTSCCGDDQTLTTTETYADAYGGCWKGNAVFHNQRLSESTRNAPDQDGRVIYYDGAFYGCRVAEHDGVDVLPQPSLAKKGRWTCGMDGIWRAEGRTVEMSSRLFVSAKLYNASNEKDFSLSCGKVGELLVQGGGSAVDSWFACLLNNQPEAFSTEQVYVGIAYEDADTLFANLNRFVPFANATTENPIRASDGVSDLNSSFLDHCSVSGDSQNLTKCPLKQGGGATMHLYHNKDHHVIIMGFSALTALEESNLFETIWNAIKDFFVNLFGSGTTHGLEAFPLTLEEAAYEKFYFAKAGKKSILATYEQIDQEQNVMKIAYKNFYSLNLSSFVDATKTKHGVGSANYLLGCNQTIILFNNLDSPETYWPFYTSNIRINKNYQQGSIISGNCSGTGERACIDTDNDGYGVLGETDCRYPGQVDCDDTDPAINPGATEVCGDGVDQNCNGVDPRCPPEGNITFICPDKDGDGFNQSGAGCGVHDCDDTDAGINPGMSEFCGDGVDQNCDGQDEVCPDEQLY